MEDGDIEVDDLFGDADPLGDTSLNLPLNGTGVLPALQPLVRGLAKHVDELQLSGCRQKLAWSRQGCLAYISQDRATVNLRCVRFQPIQGLWDLSRDYPVDALASFDHLSPILHLQWSHTGADLAIADAAGRVSILSMSMTALNQFTVVRPATMDYEEELGQAVGMYWLNADRPNATMLHSSRDDDRWTHIVTRRKPHGPYWHRALALVTRSGALRLIYQKTDGKWATSKIELQHPASAGCLLTHAALAPTQENKLLISTHTSDSKFFVHLVQIHWPDLRQDPTADPDPTISVEHVRGNMPGGILEDTSEADDLLSGRNISSSASLRLAHLDIIPTSDIDKAVRSPPAIVAVYVSGVSSLGMLAKDHIASSTVCRWHISVTQRTLHPSFDDIGSKPSKHTLTQKISLQRLGDVHVDQIITGMQQVDSANAIAMSCQDGSITFYNPSTMTQLYLETDINEVTSMSQSGFTFPPDPTALQRAFSPSGCAAVSVDGDGKLQLSTMEYSGGLQPSGTDDDSPSFHVALASINLTFARACYSSSTTDDILLFILRSFRPDQYPLLMSSFYKSLFRDPDLYASPRPGSDIDKLAQKPMVAKVLSLQAALGHNTTNSTATSNSSSINSAQLPSRDLLATFTWTTLNIRYVAMQFYVILSSAKQTGGIEWREPEILDLVCNNIRWALDLFKFIVDDLFETADTSRRRSSNNNDSKSNSADNMDLSTIPTTKQEMPTALLVTSLWSRYFLKTISRVLRGLVAVPKSPTYNSLQPSALLAFAKIAEVIESSSLKMEAFERLLGGADKFVQIAYEQAGYGERDCADCERGILSSGNLSVLDGVVGRLVEEVLPVIRGQVDRLLLWVGDYSWVGVKEGTGAVSTARDDAARKIDIHRKRKVVLVARGKANGNKDEGVAVGGGNGGSTSSNSNGNGSNAGALLVRRCVRCSSLSGDVNGAPKEFPKFSQQQLMRCVCESSFVVEELDVLKAAAGGG